MKMKLIEGLNYRQWQKRNSDQFNSLTPEQKKKARQKGYYNSGWDKVQKSWQIINNITHNVVSLFDHYLTKGKLIEAIDLAILDSENALDLAKSAKEELERLQQKSDQIADDFLAKYTLL